MHGIQPAIKHGLDHGSSEPFTTKPRVFFVQLFERMPLLAFIRGYTTMELMKTALARQINQCGTGVLNGALDRKSVV